MAKRGYRPQRTCLGCGARADQAQMIRLAAAGPDQLRVERHQGRGGYLHRDERCQRAFVGRKGMYRAFHVEVNRAAKTKLIEELTGRDGE
ncbi:MAG: DUF448 domain-containing protein [Deltaproteobacteria bacterium]|nr:DUF448 domain-containing protein [Deltaproteobacteria bacterium]